MKCHDCKFISGPGIIGQSEYPSVRCILGIWDKENKQGVHPVLFVMTVEQAAEYLQISRPSAYLAVKRGEIPVIRIRRTIRVPVSALEKMLANAGASAARG